jgi:predicted HAD superfamily Cof-like phosphohydrolase
MAYSPYAIQTAVTNFHEKYGHPIRSTPNGNIPLGEAQLSLALIDEEVEELADALFTIDGLDGEFSEPRHTPNIVEIADALGDIVWTAYSAAIRHGIDLDLVLAEIARSNDTKTPAAGPGTKIQKGPDYSAPDIARVLRTQPALVSA